jgi:hypothetical protein
MVQTYKGSKGFEKKAFISELAVFDTCLFFRSLTHTIKTFKRFPNGNDCNL